jgi:aspartyl/asparaginyl beta-hydroxylase (cupin superfamily)
MTGDSTIDLLEANWEGIRDECRAMASPYISWPEHQLYNGRWDVYGIYDIQGNRMDEHAAECPFTTSVIEQIPNLRTAGFSMLGAGCLINPHRGYTDAVLRCHLGLIVPDGDCALKVEETVYRWQEGKAFIFNDRLLHEAWNLTDHARYVLLLDLYK